MNSLKKLVLILSLTTIVVGMEESPIIDAPKPVKGAAMINNSQSVLVEEMSKLTAQLNAQPKMLNFADLPYMQRFELEYERMSTQLKNQMIKEFEKTHKPSSFSLGSRVAVTNQELAARIEQAEKILAQQRPALFQALYPEVEALPTYLELKRKYLIESAIDMSMLLANKNLNAADTINVLYMIQNLNNNEANFHMRNHEYQVQSAMLQNLKTNKDA